MNAYILSPDNAMVCQLSYTGEGACQDIFNKPITLLNYCIEILKFENSDSTLETRPWQGYLIAYNENILWLQCFFQMNFFKRKTLEDRKEDMMD